MIELHIAISDEHVSVCSRNPDRQSVEQSSLQDDTDAFENVCGACDQGFSTMKELFKHMDEHESLADNTCEICSEAFKDVQGKGSFILQRKRKRRRSRWVHR